MAPSLYRALNCPIGKPVIYRPNMSTGSFVLTQYKTLCLKRRFDKNSKYNGFKSVEKLTKKVRICLHFKSKLHYFDLCSFVEQQNVQLDAQHDLHETSVCTIFEFGVVVYGFI